jgi:hypothetical protein
VASTRDETGNVEMSSTFRVKIDCDEEAGLASKTFSTSTATGGVEQVDKSLHHSDELLLSSMAAN